MSAVPGTGKWSVTVARADGTKEEFKDIPCKTDWTKCYYILWSGQGTTKAAFYLDNVMLNRESTPAP